MDAPSGTATRRSRLTSEGTHLDAFGTRDWMLLLVSGLVWGSSFIFIAEGVEHFSRAVVTFGRIALGALTLSLFPVARRTRIAREDWPRLMVLSVLWLAFPMTLFPIAQQHISSGLAGMLNGSIPVFAAVVASVSLGRLPGRAQRAGLLVGVVGVVLLGLPALSEGGSSAFGVLLILAACVSYGVAIPANVPLAQRYGAVAVFWRCQLLSLVLTAPAACSGSGRRAGTPVPACRSCSWGCSARRSPSSA